jgi:amino acid adenylation domain-containing protein/non-ribosomal peptide synthase protein (TIGR01720 family)
MDNGIAKRLIEHAQNGILIHISNGALKVSDPEGRLTDPERLGLKNNKELILKLFAEWEVKSNGSIGHLSYQQQRLWLIDKIERGTARYNMPWALRFDGTLDANAMGRALSAILNRHQVLRTVYKLDDRGESIQVVRDAVELPLPVVDLCHLAGEEQEQAREVSRLTERESSLPFDMTSDLMLRATLLRLAARSWVLLVTMHHIASDGWSEGILTSELCSLYEAFVQGRDNPLPPPPIQYMDYAHWQREWLQDGVLEKQLEYWAGQLKNLPAVHNLPLDRPRPSIPSYRGGIVHRRLSAEIWQGLNALAQSHGVTLFMILNAAFATLLSRYSGETDIVIGSPIANREKAELAPLVGFFVNTLVLRSDLSGDPGFIDVLAQAKERLLAAYEHQQIPFEKLVDELKPERSLSHNPLFQVMLVLHNTVQAQMNFPGLTLRSAESVSTLSKFDLTLNVMKDHDKDGLYLGWGYAADLFDASTIERMAGHFEVLLQGIVENPGVKVSKLPLLTAAEKNRLLVEWNATAMEYRRDKTIHQLFEEQVEQRPEAIALVYEDRRLSYEELNRQANRLAHYLIKQGVRPDTYVGICLERSLEMVISILGILKAGGCYLPLDPTYPEQRLHYILENSAVERVLTHGGLRAVLGILGKRGICLDGLDLSDQPSVNPGIRLEPRHAAYAIYTSGSTGQPKGVVNHHGGLMNRLAWMQRQLQMSPADKVLQKTPFTFDVSVWEFLWPLREGAQLVLARPEGHKDPEYLADVIERCGISILHFVPSMLEAFLSAQVLSPVNSLKHVVCSGEELPRELVRKFKAWSGSIGLYNLYGPTEASIDVSCFVCEGLPEQRVPIGRPIDNTQLFVLDGHMTPVPVGVPGELYIGGAGLARGYLNRPELTTERFVPNPFHDPRNASDSERLYRTGDLVRYLADGNIEFLGRMDHQVKIRGFRIELGEIEHALLSQPEIKEAVVVAHARDGGDKYLAAYVVPQVLSDRAGRVQLDHEVLRQALRMKLPEYMVPAYFVELDALPLSPNGKVERKALLPPDVSQLQTKAYVAPATEMEQQLVQIWSEVLKVPAGKIGTRDNFFQLGGDSLLAITAVTRAFEQKIRLTVKQLFQHQTIENLAKVAEAAADFSNEPEVVSGELPLTIAQKWFFSENYREPERWNAGLLLEVRPDIDHALLKQSVMYIVRQHDALRTRFSRSPSEWQAFIPPVMADTPFFVIDIADLSATGQKTAIEKTAEEMQGSLRFTEGLLFKVVLFDCGPDRAGRLLIISHHLVADGPSLAIIFEDLQTAYRQLKSARNITFHPKTASVRAVAEMAGKIADSNELLRELDYWASRPWNEIALPVDFPRTGGTNEVSTTRSVTASLSSEDTACLLTELPRRTGFKFVDALLTALVKTITGWTGNQWMQTVYIDSGRSMLSVDYGLNMARSVGWFSLSPPLFLQKVSANNPLTEIKQVKQQLEKIPRGGLGYDFLYWLSNDPAVRERIPPVSDDDKIVFNYQGVFNLDGAFSGDFLGLAKENPGSNQNSGNDRSCAFMCLSYVRDGRFYMDWKYSNRLYKSSTIEKLVDDFMGNLGSIASYSKYRLKTAETSR